MNFASFGIILALLPSVFALRCLKCNQAKTVNLCADIATCDDITEECYLEKVTTANLQLVFNGGCRSKQVCTLLQSLGIGKKRATSCSKCCGADTCNANLCQENLAPADHCCNQHGVRDFSSCTHFLQCQDDEACSLKTFFRNQYVVHDLGCEKRVACLKGGDSYNFGEVIVPPQTKKDQLPDDMLLCQACCRGDQCNIQYTTCTAMLHSMVPSNFTR